MRNWAESSLAVAERDDELTIKSGIERELEAEALDRRDDADGALAFPDGPQQPD